MWIITEGATCTGKSTLHQRLIDAPGLEKARTVHFSQPKELTRDWALLEYVTKWARNSSKNVLGDRWHWGEQTYAPIYRPDTNDDGFGLLGRAGWRWTELFLASRGACVALTTADNETLEKRLTDRGDDHVADVPTLLRISSLYELARRDSITTAAILDTSDVEAGSPEYQTFIDSLVEEANRRAKASRKITRLQRNYIGVLQPDTLLVTHRSGSLSLPLVPTLESPGDTLLANLPDMFWRSLGLLQFDDETTEDKVVKMLDTLDHPNVVALDRDSAEMLDSAGAQYAEISVTAEHGGAVFADAVVSASTAQDASIEE